jgi:hypothetical protein
LQCNGTSDRPAECISGRANGTTRATDVRNITDTARTTGATSHVDSASDIARLQVRCNGTANSRSGCTTASSTFTSDEVVIRCRHRPGDGGLSDSATNTRGAGVASLNDQGRQCVRAAALYRHGGKRATSRSGSAVSSLDNQCAARAACSVIDVADNIKRPSSSAQFLR